MVGVLCRHQIRRLHRIQAESTRLEHWLFSKGLVASKAVTKPGYTCLRVATVVHQHVVELIGHLKDDFQGLPDEGLDFEDAVVGWGVDFPTEVSQREDDLPVASIGPQEAIDDLSLSCHLLDVAGFEGLKVRVRKTVL